MPSQKRGVKLFSLIAMLFPIDPRIFVAYVHSHQKRTTPFPMRASEDETHAVPTRRVDTTGEEHMTTFKTFHDDARNAIRDANAAASQTGIPQVVGYVQGFGWTHYDPRNGAAPGVEPELLCFALGKVPLPLSESGFDVLFSAAASVA
jgi:hypothetical protein